jgi:hypothetical protein
MREAAEREHTMSLRRHIAISRSYGANWLAESKALIASGLIMTGTN